MRILFINSLYPPDTGGGAEITLANIVKGMTNRGHTTAVLATHPGKGIKVSTENNTTIYRSGIRNIYWHHPPRAQPSWQRLLWHSIDSYNPLAAYDVNHVINQFKPEIISCHNLPGISVSAWTTAARAGVPSIQLLHDYYSICPKSTLYKESGNCASPCASCKLFRLPHPGISNRIKAVVGVSQAVLDKHLEAGLFSKVPIKKVIYNARTLRSTISPQRDPESITFGFIGSLTVVKGIDELIQAFIRIAGRNLRKVRLVIGGTGKDNYVNELKQRYGHDIRIEFLGQVNPATFFNQVDITVVPSLWHEPLGMVVPESLGFNVPVIGAKRGGIPEMIKHEINGLLYNPDEPYALDKAMMSLVENQQLLASMKLNAAPSAIRFLNEGRMLDEHEDLYKKIIRNNLSA